MVDNPVLGCENVALFSRTSSVEFLFCEQNALDAMAPKDFIGIIVDNEVCNFHSH
jgi:hypothetical protein